MNINYIFISKYFSLQGIAAEILLMLAALITFSVIHYSFFEDKAAAAAGFFFNLTIALVFFAPYFSEKIVEHKELPSRYGFESYSSLKKNIEILREIAHDDSEVNSSIESEEEYINEILNKHYLKQMTNPKESYIEKKLYN